MLQWSVIQTINDMQLDRAMKTSGPTTKDETEFPTGWATRNAAALILNLHQGARLRSAMAAASVNSD